MAKRTISKYFSDLSGEEIDSTSPTLYFAFDGASYEVDLTEAEQAAFKDLVAPYIAVGRRAGGTPRRGKASGPSPKEIRAWATSQGLDVPARGRIPGAIADAYAAAH